MTIFSNDNQLVINLSMAACRRVRGAFTNMVRRAHHNNRTCRLNLIRISYISNGYLSPLRLNKINDQPTACNHEETDNRSYKV